MAFITDFFQSRSTSAKNGLIVGIIAIVLVTMGAVYWVLSDSYAVLFKDLEQQDAASIISELDNKKIPYKIKDDGATIMVSAAKVHKIRLQLMGSNARLTGGVGFELFDNSDFGMTEFVQKINYQRALQGELTRTITSLDEIKHARVHLVLPENSLFRDNKKTASASVTLFVKNGYHLKNKQVGGIQRLIASSVPGMDISAVAISDQDGVLLSQNIVEDADSRPVSYRLRMRKEIESYLAEKANKLLVRTFGTNEALVSVDVTLDLDKVKSTLEDVIPSREDKKGIIKKRETKNSTDKKNDNVTTEVEYRVGRKVNQVVTTPGSIKHLSVGVLVPSDTTARRVMQIEELVSAAVGIDKARGDEIVVHAVALPVVKSHDVLNGDENNPKVSYRTYIDQSLVDKAFAYANADKAGKSTTSQQGATSVSASRDQQVLNKSDTLADEKTVPSKSLSAWSIDIFKIFEAVGFDAEFLHEVKHLAVTKYRIETIIGLTTIAILLILALVKYLVARSTGTLSQAEREQILRQLQEWLNSENKQSLKEVKQ